MPNVRLALHQEKRMTLEVENSPVFGCPVFPRRRSSGESTGTNSSSEEHVRIIPAQLYSPRATGGFPCTILTPGITVSASSPTPSPSPINGDCPAQVHSNSNMILQRSPSGHSRNNSIRRNTSGTRLGPTSPSMATRSGVSRSQSLRTSRSRPQSLEQGNRFRNRIASIPCDMIIPGTANYDGGRHSRASSNHSLPLPTDESEYTRLRNFSVTAKGLVNRGDSFRSKSRSSHSVASSHSGGHRQGSTDQETIPTVHIQGSANSLGVVEPQREGGSSPIPVVTAAAAAAASVPTVPEKNSTKFPDHKSYRVLLLGAQEVGKSALTSQFTTSEYICSYDSSQEEENEKTVEVVLNGEESEMVFVEYPHVEDMQPLLTVYKPDAYVVVYSVTSKRSFQQAKELLHLIARVQEEPNYSTRAVILVGNKTDLVRLRAVTTEDGRAVASSHDCKFIETSVGINHHVDELLVGTLAQIRLKHRLSEKRRASSLKESSGQGKASRAVSRNSSSTSSYSCPGCKAKGLIKRILKKACSKSKSCDNLHVL